MTSPLMKPYALTLAIFVASSLLASAGDHSAKSPVKASKSLVTDSKTPITDAKAPITKGPCLSYDYIDLDYGIFNPGGGPFDDGDGYGVNFSKSLGEIFFLTGGYTNAGADYDFGGNSFDFESHRYSLGLGAHFGLTECVDLTIEGGVTHSDNRFGGNHALNYDSWAYYVAPGVRARFGRFEGFARVFYFDREGVPAQFGFEDDGWVFNPGLLFHLTDTLALKVAADLTEDNSLVTFGARIHF